MQICPNEEENSGKEFLHEIISSNPQIAEYVLTSILSSISGDLKESLHRNVRKRIPTFKMFIIYECLQNLLPHSFYGKLSNIIDIFQRSNDYTRERKGKITSIPGKIESFNLGDQIEIRNKDTLNKWKSATIVKVDMKKQEYSIELPSGKMIITSFHDPNIRRISEELNEPQEEPDQEQFVAISLDGGNTLTTSVESERDQASSSSNKKTSISIVELLHQFDIVTRMVKMLFPDQVTKDENQSKDNKGLKSFTTTVAKPIYCSHSCTLQVNDLDFKCAKCKKNISCGLNSQYNIKLFQYRWKCSSCRLCYCTNCFTIEEGKFAVLENAENVEVVSITSTDSIDTILSKIKGLAVYYSANSENLSSTQSIETETIEIPIWGSMLKLLLEYDSCLKKSYLPPSESGLFDKQNFQQLKQKILAYAVLSALQVTYHSKWLCTFLTFLSYRKVFPQRMRQQRHLLFFKTKKMTRYLIAAFQKILPLLPIMATQALQQQLLLLVLQRTRARKFLQ